MKPLVRLGFGMLRPRKPILGADFAGEVSAVGDQVRTFKSGDKAFGSCGLNLGAHAEHAVVAADGLIGVALAPTKGIVVEADTGGKVKAFFQFNAIGWLMGARMLRQDFGNLFPADEIWIVNLIHWLGMVWFLCAAVLTITSGIAYFRRHWRVVME